MMTGKYKLRLFKRVQRFRNILGLVVNYKTCRWETMGAKLIRRADHWRRRAMLTSAYSGLFSLEDVSVSVVGRMHLEARMDAHDLYFHALR